LIDGAISLHERDAQQFLTARDVLVMFALSGGDE